MKRPTGTSQPVYMRMSRRYSGFKSPSFFAALDFKSLSEAPPIKKSPMNIPIPDPRYVNPTVEDEKP